MLVQASFQKTAGRPDSVGPSDVESEEENNADEDVEMGDAPPVVRLSPLFSGLSTHSLP